MAMVGPKHGQAGWEQPALLSLVPRLATLVCLTACMEALSQALLSQTQTLTLRPCPLAPAPAPCHSCAESGERHGARALRAPGRGS
jgi:hypothetical protein